ncbi:uncharacterized protein LOC126999735 [Eriocheir sinensis]|uniref:uncharacterized protein LOC126999735 n=1 Tax=Eriocheir sinensis TaxID=95602 RepID=UPI0021C798FB|nr:uncharacterized protein LOC126999735 [Eriocheir sinensis]XP_050718530.1 uncharacterized protein LOC126999735 [Eriocheir sinensis]
MDREWTYRPPVLVGERVVWLGGAAGLGAGESCGSSYQPHHGTVSWIGRVADMGNDWAVGVEFELDMPGGCDGTWKGRRLFSCPNMRGLFLPVASIVKEKEFYDNKTSSSKTSTSIDLSLAPEPPPPKSKTSPPHSSFLSASSSQHNSKSSGKKQSDDDGKKTSKNPSTHKTSGASSVSPSSCAAVTTSSQCSSTSTSTYTSKKQPLPGRLVNTGPQDTPQDNSFSQKETSRTPTSGSTENGATGIESEGDRDESSCTGSMYFGETMVRKSITTASYEYSERVRLPHQPSISTPSSPSLSEYQRHYGKKLSSSSTSTTASDLSKCMSTPGRYSATQSPFAERKERSGFFSFFRWFRNRDKKKRSASVDGMSNTSSGSINSLASSFSSSAYSPIIRSKSADIQNRVDTKHQGQFGITRRYKLFSRNSSLGRTDSGAPLEGCGRRLSAISACSETSSKPGSRCATLTRKKRQAPQPPGSPKQSDTESLKSQKSCASLPARELRPTKSPESSLPTSPDQGASDRRLHKSKSEGLIYTRVKRRAPQPPIKPSAGDNSDKDSGKASSIQGHSKGSTVSKGGSGRPVSTVSNVSSLSQSLSSASTTLKSQSSSVASSGPSSSQYSGDSMVLESGFLRQDISKSTSSPAIADTGKVTLSPRPWYKRKNKSKESSKSVTESEKSETIYDSWMPEIQFTRRKLNLTGSLRKGKSSDAAQPSKDDKKEKRKSQVSLLANISELDRAASEQMQREQESKQVQRQTYDSKFYRTNEPHFLTQTDFLPQAKDRYTSEASDLGTMSSSECATLKSCTSVKTDLEERNLVHCESGIYDNLSLSDQEFTLPQSYSKQATLRMDERERVQHVTSDQGHPSHDIDSSIRAFSSVAVSSSTTNANPTRSSVDATRVQSPPASTETPPSPVTRDSPMHRATIDAELFYQLAKDSHEPKVKSSPILSGIREAKRMISEQASGGETEEENIHMVESPNSPRRPNKNFGFRMNNFFSPDVSTIIEASESMTSSATTPADDIYDDLPISSVHENRRRGSMQDEAASEVNYEFQLNSSDAREIMRELADVRQEIDKINEEEEKESRERERSKAEKIREEVLQLREANNFEAWHNAIEQRGGATADITSPSPVNLNEGPNRKLKWACEVCTLNNLPWRLQCEACMARRPANPKRVDEDGKSVASDFVSPQESVSNESPITVIFEEDGNGNRECPREVLEGAGAVVAAAGNAEASGNDQNAPNDKKKRDINWERELQKYFRTFDEHVKTGNSDTPGEREAVNKPLRTDAASSRQTNGRVTQKSERETGVRDRKPADSTNDNRGAKPKIKFFGTATGPPSTFIPAPETSAIRDRSGQNNSITEESHVDGGSRKLPDMEAIRRARLAKFQGSVSSENGDVESAPALRDMEKKTRIMDDRRRKKSVTETQTTNRTTVETQEEFTHTTETQECTNSEYKINDSSSPKHHKPQVIMPSGAVRTVVSIFNQFEQLQQANKDKPVVTRRKSSSGTLIERTQAFEQVPPESTSPDLQAVRRRDKPKKVKDVSPRDKEVFSAIAKFDEMAAMAELESISKFRHKSRTPKRPKVFKASIECPQGNERSVGAVNMASRSPKTPRHSASSQSPPDSHNQGGHASLDPTSTEGVIKDGVLYTEQRKRSTSISSGTFELIHAKDFMSIEAQHSESSSYSNTRDASIVSSPTPSSEAIVPDIVVEQMNGDGCSVDDQSVASPPTLAPKMDEPECRRNLERKDVERLSRQLTEADGIATFKASLRVEEPALGQTNTLNINRLLKRLEGAIARGNHAEAAKLAHELADFRVSCSVTRNKNGSSSATLPTPTNQDVAATTTRSQDAQQHAPVPSDSESSGMQHPPSSNASECYYDAAEDMDDEELSVDDHDRLLDMGCVNSLEALIQTKETRDPEPTPVIDAKPSTPVTKSIQSHPEQTSKLEPSHAAVNGVEAPQTAKSSEATSTTQHEAPKVSSNSPSATKRDARVDPARREVKSDIISKLPEGLHTHMKEEKQANQPFNVKMYVEDKNSHQGPLSFTVTPNMTVGQLREKVRQDFGFPPEVQRWILGKRLADDDLLTLEHHRVTSEGCPIFLYLVAPDFEPQTKASGKGKWQERGRYGESSRGGDLHASGNGRGVPRYLEVYDEEGNVEYRYYNPESRRYEVSEDLDDEEEEEEDDEEEDEDDEYDDDGDDEDTLEEDELEEEEERVGNQNMYQNANQNHEELHNPRTQLIPATNVNKSSVQPSGNQRKDSLDAKYSLPPPINAHPTPDNKNELMNQRNILNGHSSTSNDQEVIKNNTNEPRNINNPSDVNVRPGNHAKQQEKVENKERPQPSHHQQSQSPITKDSYTRSPVQSDPHANNNQNSSPRGRASQKEEYNVRIQNQKNSQQQQMQVAPKAKLQYPQTQKIGLTLDATSAQIQKSKPEDIHSLNIPERQQQQQQQTSETGKQRGRPEHQTANASPAPVSPQPTRSHPEKHPSPSRVHGWVCPSCTLVNTWSRPGCEACATERPGTSHQQVTGADGKGSGLGAVVSVLDRQGYVPNPHPFECRVCFLDVDSGQGVVLRDCLHTFCRECLANAVRYSDTADVKCPYRDNQYSCDSSLQDREIKALVTEKEYEQHLNKSVKQAEGAMQNVFHCLTPDCPGFCQFEDNVNEFHCDVCGKVNCLTCQAQHEGTTCQEYQDDLASKVDEAAMKTKKFFDDMIRRGDGLPCPKCSVMLVRKWGCDWMRCPMCRTEICWVTRGPRWGPGGPGDVSGGCKCGIRGQKCHPKCTYCH